MVFWILTNSFDLCEIAQAAVCCCCCYVQLNPFFVVFFFLCFSVALSYHSFIIYFLLYFLSLSNRFSVRDFFVFKWNEMFTHFWHLISNRCTPNLYYFDSLWFLLIESLWILLYVAVTIWWLNQSHFFFDPKLQTTKKNTK